MSTISERVKQILAYELEVSPGDLHDDTALLDLGLDSLSFLEMIAEFKDEFNITFSINEISEYLREHPIRTVGRLIHYVEELLLQNVRI